MTGDEIVRAITCCLEQSGCKGCPLSSFYSEFEKCQEVLIKNIISVINQQTIEIDRLKSMNQAKLDTIHDLLKDNKELTPKKPLWKKYSEETRCPDCNTFVLLHNKHCIECGRAIDWSDWDG